MEWDKLINPSNNEGIMSINQLIQKIRLKSKADELMLITESINTAIKQRCQTSQIIKNKFQIN